LLWRGTADSAVDLNALLPPTLSGSIAYTIDAQGNIWGTAYDSAGNIHAVEWSPVPEPATFILAVAGAWALFGMRHARFGDPTNSSFPAISP
jgi:YD repeat-containing protein